MILIGVSPCFLYPDDKRPVYGPKSLSYVENDMARYLAGHGVMPVLIPDLSGEQLENFLAGLEGIVFQGGSDMAPESYGAEAMDPKRWPGDVVRDRFELKLMDDAIRNQKPVLGICRGCELINVFFGGTLYQDIATECPEALVHRDAKNYDRQKHAIHIEPDGLLEQIYGGSSVRQVNSVHHQGINKLGKGLRVEAISPQDKLIEAISYQEMADQWVLGVQWHPEFSHTLGDEVLDPKPLYDAFIAQLRS